MAKELTEAERQQIVRQLLAEMRARPDDQPMSRDEWESFLTRVPPRNDGWSSADLIRELRGPLPPDDSDHHDRR